MNLSETAFPEPQDSDGTRRLRWFTPALEIPLCGHATLATAHVLFAKGEASPLRFVTRSGELVVHAEDDGRLRMDFPTMPAVPADAPAGLLAALGCDVSSQSAQGPTGQYWLVEVDSQAQVAALAPDFTALGRVALGDRVGVAVTARGDANDIDFVSRFFAPWAGIDEDPVTGSSHCMLAPWWSPKLGKESMNALQISGRLGTLEVRIVGDRVHLVGHAVTVSDGHLVLPD
jgi:PhzF family phenazine biosynthesis protein